MWRAYVSMVSVFVTLLRHKTNKIFTISGVVYLLISTSFLLFYECQSIFMNINIMYLFAFVPLLLFLCLPIRQMNDIFLILFL